MAGFIKFDGIDGAATDSKHGKWCDIESFSHGASGPGNMSSGGVGAGKVSLNDYMVAKYLDGAGPKLLQKCCDGTAIPKVTVDMTTTFGKAAEVYLKYEFEDVFITSYTIGGSSDGGTMPMETTTFSFSKIKMTFTPHDSKGGAGGPVEATWNPVENTP